MVKELISPRTARWILRACVLAGAAVWWLLAQSTGAFADDRVTPAGEDPTVEAATDAVADVAEATATRTTGLVREVAQRPAVQRILPRVTEPAVETAADHVETTTLTVGDTVRTAGVALAGHTPPLPAAPDQPAGPAEPAGSPTTATPAPAAPVASAAPGREPRHRGPSTTGGARDDRRVPAVRQRAAPAPDPTARLLSSRTARTHAPSGPAADRPAERPAPPLGHADDAGQAAQGSSASGGASSTPASSTLTRPPVHLRPGVPASWAIPPSSTEKPDSTPD